MKMAQPDPEYNLSKPGKGEKKKRRKNISMPIPKTPCIQGRMMLR
jgi:hypothetical protein